MTQAFLYGISWAGIVMLFNFCMWENNILSWYWEWLNKSKYRITKVFGLCDVCFGFWFGMWYLIIDHTHYLIFLGVSELILVLYNILLLFLKK